MLELVRAMVELCPNEAVKTAERTGTKNELVLDNHKYLRDTARQ